MYQHSNRGRDQGDIIDNHVTSAMRSSARNNIQTYFDSSNFFLSLGKTYVSKFLTRFILDLTNKNKSKKSYINFKNCLFSLISILYNMLLLHNYYYSFRFNHYSFRFLDLVFYHLTSGQNEL